MKIHKLPVFAILISLLTLCCSLYVAFEINGSLFGNVRVIQLEEYGGVTIEHLLNFEVWRLFSSQLVHVKQLHMLYNVASLFLLSLLVERQLGSVKTFFIWFLAGSAGTVFSTFFVPAPWNLGTGASQAIFGLAACCVLMLYKKINTSRHLKFAIAFTMIPALSLDMIFAHHPKPGHLLSFCVGLTMSYFLLNNTRSDLEKSKIA